MQGVRWWSRTIDFKLFAEVDGKPFADCTYDSVHTLP
jgi:hypothetical protein